MAKPGEKKKEHDFLIAIVDDHIDTVTSMSNYLEAKGFRTAWAYTGLDAIELCKSKSPDILILDIRMPGMDGFEVADALPKTQKIIFMSGFDGVEEKVGKYRNCIGLLQKPIDLDQAESLLRKEFRLEKSVF
jgi:CheY-like chemotaxis protein